MGFLSGAMFAAHTTDIYCITHAGAEPLDEKLNEWLDVEPFGATNVEKLRSEFGLTSRRVEIMAV